MGSPSLEAVRESMVASSEMGPVGRLPPVGVKDAVVTVLGHPAVARAVSRTTKGELRVIAYHGVPDANLLDQHLTWLSQEFKLLSGADVSDAIRSGRAFPAQGAWLTFDDGLANVIERGLPVLEAHGAPATLFVSPGVSESSDALWWDTITCAVNHGWPPPFAVDAAQVVRRLKGVPDTFRRDVVTDATTFLHRHADSVDEAARVARRREIEFWMSSGREVGNHTWDHPCLDRCTPDEQCRQIESADEWLKAVGAFDNVRLFAYPNGDWTPDAEAVLADMGYDVGLLFDHRLATRSNHRLRVSRLRLDSTAPVARARAVLSGGHALVYRVSNSRSSGDESSPRVNRT